MQNLKIYITEIIRIFIGNAISSPLIDMSRICGDKFQMQKGKYGTE